MGRMTISLSNKKKSFPIEIAKAQYNGTRDEQQDSVLWSNEENFKKKGLLAILSDGMGGMNNGEVFSAIGTQKMIECFESIPPKDDLCEELEECFAAAQSAAVEAQDEKLKGGATVTAILIRDGRCAFLSIGDSKIFLVRGKGIIQLNREHKLGITLDEAAAFGYMDEEFARLNLRRKALTQYLGNEKEAEYDLCVEPFMVMPGDRLAMTSDGVTDALSMETLETLLMDGSCEEAANGVIQAIRDRNRKKQDNSSIILIGFSNEIDR